MTDPLIEQIKADRNLGTDPKFGRWQWHGQPNRICIATEYGGRRYVMDFVRKGLQGAQPRFQIDGCMHKAADELAEFSVGQSNVRGHSEAVADPTVYRYDICAVDHPDARRIARVPEMEARILADAEEKEALRKALSKIARDARNCAGDSDSMAFCITSTEAAARAALTSIGDNDA